MIIAPEEKSTRGGLIAFIDLLFLLVAFFTLLLFFVQQRNALSEQQMNAVQERLAQIAGKEVNVPEALEVLDKAVDRLLAAREAEAEREREAAMRRERRARRNMARLEYTLQRDETIVYEGRSYTVERFLDEVVTPLRKSHWVAFRAFADAKTPFGAVIDHRKLLLRDSNEFDTYWDNVTRGEPASAEKAEAPARRAR